MNNFDIALPSELSAAIKNNRIPHAVILEGGSSQKRRETAALLAAALVCTGGDNRPCGVCAACKKAAADNHPDISVVSGTEKINSIGVDIIRNIRHGAYIMPNEAARKVYVIQNAQSMSEQALNALLKILEEPPEYVSFIMECPSKAVLLGTVLSRSTVFDVGGEDGSSIDPEIMKKARAAALALAKATAGNEIDMMKATAVFEKDKELLRIALPELQSIFRDALVIKYGGKAAFGSEDIPAHLSESLSEATLCRLIDTVPEFISLIKKNANHNLLITRLCCKLMHT